MSAERTEEHECHIISKMYSGGAQACFQFNPVATCGNAAKNSPEAQKTFIKRGQL